MYNGLGVGGVKCDFGTIQCFDISSVTEFLFFPSDEVRYTIGIWSNCCKWSKDRQFHSKMRSIVSIFEVWNDATSQLLRTYVLVDYVRWLRSWQVNFWGRCCSRCQVRVPTLQWLCVWIIVLILTWRIPVLWQWWIFRVFTVHGLDVQPPIVVHLNNLRLRLAGWDLPKMTTLLIEFC